MKKVELNNPFVVYGYKGAAYFCDREEETRKVMDALQNERNVTLIAPRRIGKTGLIHHVFAETEQQDAEVRCFYIDLFALQLKEIDEDKYLAFANRFFAHKKTTLSKEVFHHLYDKVDGQTWYVQALLSRLYSYMDFTPGVTPPLIDNAIEELVNEQEVAFEDYYASLTTNQATLLQAIAREGGVKSPLAQTFIKKHRLPALSSIKTALKALIDRQMVCQYGGRYIVYDRFFAIWLRR